MHINSEYFTCVVKCPRAGEVAEMPERTGGDGRIGRRSANGGVTGVQEQACMTPT